MKTVRLILIGLVISLSQISLARAQTYVMERGSSPEQPAVIKQYPTLDKQVRFSIDVGYSYRLGEIADGISSDIARQMRSGFNYGAELLYFPVQAWGFGAKFTGRHFSVSSAGLKDNTNMYYFAPMVAGRVFDRKGKNAWIFGISLGYISFIEKVEYNGIPNRISEGGLGSTFEIGYDIRMGNNTFFGLKLSMTSGTVNINNTKENASSFDLSLGLRF